VIKRFVFVALGIGMIVGGVAGITSSVLDTVDQKNRADLREIERLRNESQTALTQEQTRLQEREREIEGIRASVEAERKRLAEERRALADQSLARERTVDLKRDHVVEAKPAPPNTYSKNRDHDKKHDKKREGTRLSKEQHRAKSREDHERRKSAPAVSGAQRYGSERAPGAGIYEDEIKRVGNKAGLEAATFLEPVQYLNERTRVRVLAEPWGYHEGRVRVRLRVWRHETLVQDTLISFLEAGLREPRIPRI
jgi:hypothetical protein